MTEEKRIAILIDADNIAAKYLEIIIAQANLIGRISTIKVYGDWSDPKLKPWKERAAYFSLSYVQQYANISAKPNASDFTMIIDAMDLLYSKKISAFCIVSSDSDFTRLVIRLKEDGVFLFGMGEVKTPEVLINAYDSFVYLDTIYKEQNPSVETTLAKTTESTVSSVTPLTQIVKKLKMIIDQNKEDDGWAYWSVIASLLKKSYPAFHPRNYGKKSTTTLNFFKEMPDFETKREGLVAFMRVVPTKPKAKPTTTAKTKK